MAALPALPGGAAIPRVAVQGSPYEQGAAVGRAFSPLIAARLSKDRTLQTSLLPFYDTCPAGRALVDALSATNRNAYPHYWEELQGTADGSGVPFIQLLLLNLRKEIAPFLPRTEDRETVMQADQCSDVMLCCPYPGLALVGHNEDADGAVNGHIYLVEASLPSGVSFTAYTYAGELPSCAFGFNSNGIGFTLNAVAPAAEEAVKGGIGRNFVSRDLLEATDMDDALKRVQVSGLSTGHNYNLMDFTSRRIVTVETASKGRFSVLEIGEQPYFHANMYLRLGLPQKGNESSVQRKKRASELWPPENADAVLKVLGDAAIPEFPIFMTGNVYEENGPQLYTLCTALFDLDSRQVSIYGGQPQEKREILVLPLCSPKP